MSKRRHRPQQSTPFRTRVQRDPLLPLGPDEWCTGLPRPRTFNEPRKPLNFEFVCDSWYQFCTFRQTEYESRGMLTASQMWWAMRYWGDVEDPDTLTTEEGFEKEVGNYWEYKLESVPHVFDYDPSGV